MYKVLNNFKFFSVKDYFLKVRHFFYFSKDRATAKHQWSTVRIFFIFIILSGFFSLIYIFKINQLATKGYSLKTLEQQLQELREENSHLNIQVQKLHSREQLQVRINVLDMVAAQPVYAAASAGVAVNRWSMAKGFYWSFKQNKNKNMS